MSTYCSIALWLSQAQNKIDEITGMDKAIYEAGRIQFEKVRPRGPAPRVAKAAVDVYVVLVCALRTLVRECLMGSAD